jgi:histidinol-phosphate phosphatase family protein
MHAVVLAGGRGERLAGGRAGPPKPLVPLCGLAVVEHVLGWLGSEGVTDVVMCLGHRASEIETALGDGARFGLRVTYQVEAAPLGTAGAVRAALARLGERFFVVYADVVADIDLRQMAQVHAHSGAVATLAIHPSDHAFDSDRVVTDARGDIERMIRPSDGGGPEAGALCSAALYLVERRALEWPALATPCDFARDLFPALCAAGERLHAYRTTEYLKDMGTPARLAQVEADLAAGIPRALRRSAQRPAVLLDRDGVLVEDAGHLRRGDAPRLLPGAAAALRRLNQARVLAVCCTNQPVIARGEQDEDGLFAVHRLLEGMLANDGAWLDAIYTCPHHPERGFAGERADLKIACRCRKPLPGLLLQALAELGFDRRRSLVIGDRTTDLVAARAAGILGVGVRSGAACRDGRHPLAPETPIVADVGAAVSIALDTVPSWRSWLDAARAAGTIVLGGPSRAGKTIAAAALGLALGALGIDTLHLSLDRFILPYANRTPGMGVAERTRFELAARAIARLETGAAVLVPGYDPLRRTGAPGQVVQRDGRSVLILDGVLANQLEIRGALHVALDAVPEVRRSRRRTFYAWKGLEHAALDAVTRDDDEEEAAVARACRRASLHLVLGDALRLEASPGSGPGSPPEAPP